MSHDCITDQHDIQTYRELEDTNKHRVVYHSASVQGPLHGVPVNAHYQPLGAIDRKRLLARRTSTTYCYDFPLVRFVIWVWFFFFLVGKSILCFSMIQKHGETNWG